VAGNRWTGRSPWVSSRASSSSYIQPQDNSHHCIEIPYLYQQKDLLFEILQQKRLFHEMEMDYAINVVKRRSISISFKLAVTYILLDFLI
jgi:hypothetical protein